MVRCGAKSRINTRQSVRTGRDAVSTPMWFVSLVRWSFPFRSLAAKATRLPLAGRLIEGMLFEGDDIMLMPRTIAVSEEVEQRPQEVMPWQVLEHFIERAGFLWVMDECICRRSSGCKDYPVDLGCLFMGEAARGINPRLGREVTAEEARAHLARCREAGLFHLVGRNKLDTVWLNLRPGEKLLTVCNCCTCCCLWKILPDLSDDIACKLTRMPGVSVTVTEACEGCGQCIEANCMVGALRMTAGRATIGHECRGCGRCAELCPRGAIAVTFDDGAEAMARSIERLERKIDVT